MECLLDDGKRTSPDDFAKVLRNALRRAKTKKYLKDFELFSGSKVCPDEEVSTQRKVLIHTWDNLKDVAKIYRVRIEKKKKIFRRVVTDHRKKMKKAERERKRKIVVRTRHSNGNGTSSEATVEKKIRGGNRNKGAH